MICRRLFLILIVGAATPAGAVINCLPPQDGQELSVYLASYAACVEQLPSVDEIVEETEEAIEAKPAATSGFASTLRDSIEDFLPFFSFAVDSLTSADDDRSLTLRFNPIRNTPLGALALTATATEPEPSEPFLGQVSESQQAKLKELASKELGDLSDLTLAAKWGFETEADLQSRWILGRSTEQYKPLLERRLLFTVALDELTQPESQAISLKIKDCEQLLVPDDPQNLKIGELRTKLGADFDSCMDAWRAEESEVIETDAKFDKLALLPFLIDNQPQLVLSAAWHERDLIVGRDGLEVKLTFEKGVENFNSLLGEYHRALSADSTPSQRDSALVDAFWQAVDGLDEEKVKQENKFTFSLTYSTHKRDRLNRSFGEGDEAIAVTFDLEEATEWCGKLEWQRNATRQPIRIGDHVVHPRFHLSWEYIDVSDDPLRQDRMAAIATYEIPIPEGTKLPWPAGTSIPVSLTYANHSEFLGEPDEQLSAHFGISYKLPEKKKE